MNKYEFAYNMDYNASKGDLYYIVVKKQNNRNYIDNIAGDGQIAKILGISRDEYFDIAKRVCEGEYFFDDNILYILSKSAINKLLGWFNTIGMSYIIAKELGGEMNE